MTKIALVGACPSSQMLAPFDDPDWEIWSCGPNVLNKIPRVDVAFEIHADLAWQYQMEFEAAYIPWLQQQNFKKFYVQRTDLFPKGIRYPKEEMVQEFGPYWFTSTFAWMMALAITSTSRPEVIGLFGLDLSVGDEYKVQKPGVIRFVEMAMGRGIPVYVPPEADVLRPPPLYGYAPATPMGRKLWVREREIRKRREDRKKELAKTTRQLQYEIDHLGGTLDDLEYMQWTFTGEPFPLENSEESSLGEIIQASPGKET
jgi:hypothetical protein